MQFDAFSMVFWCFFFFMYRKFYIARWYFDAFSMSKKHWNASKYYWNAFFRNTIEMHRNVFFFEIPSKCIFLTYHRNNIEIPSKIRCCLMVFRRCISMVFWCISMLFWWHVKKPSKYHRIMSNFLYIEKESKYYWKCIEFALKFRWLTSSDKKIPQSNLNF